MKKFYSYLSLALFLINTISHGQTPSIEAQAKKILNTKCFSCHSDSGSASQVFGNINNTKSLLSQRIIVAKDPDHSPLVQSVVNGSMPKGGNGLSQKEIEIIKQYINGLPLPTGKDEPCITEQILYEQMKSDFLSTPLEDQPFIRYVSVANLSDPDSAIRALNKTLNSLSTEKEIYLPDVIQGALVKLDLRKIGWTAETWDTLNDSNPLKNTRANVFNQEEALRLMGTKAPIMKADFLVSTALKAPNYYRILKIPKTAALLEKSLGIDVAKNIKENKIIRSGFRNSGVSQNNRVIERHDTSFGAYWKSYDFVKNIDKENIFANPDSFVPAGGEIIYHLPNGMQAYMLVDSTGNRIDKAPISIVSDSKRPDHAVENGISCVRCHSSGMIDKVDQVGPTIASNKTIDLFRQGELENVYLAPGEFSKKIKSDNAIHSEALKKAGADINQDDLSKLIQEFEGDLDAKKIACELSISTQELTRLISDVKNLEPLIPLEFACSVPRETFVSVFPILNKNSTFSTINQLDGFSVGEQVFIKNSNRKSGVITAIDSDKVIHLNVNGSSEIFKITDLEHLLNTKNGFVAGEEIHIEDGRTKGNLFFLDENGGSNFRITRIDPDGAFHVQAIGGQKDFVFLNHPDFHFVKHKTEDGNLKKGDVIITSDSLQKLKADISKPGFKISNYSKIKIQFLLNTKKSGVLIGSGPDGAIIDKTILDDALVIKNEKNGFKVKSKVKSVEGKGSIGQGEILLILESIKKDGQVIALIKRADGVVVEENLNNLISISGK